MLVNLTTSAPNHLRTCCSLACCSLALALHRSGGRTGASAVQFHPRKRIIADTNGPLTTSGGLNRIRSRWAAQGGERALAADRDLLPHIRGGGDAEGVHPWLPATSIANAHDGAKLYVAIRPPIG